MEIENRKKEVKNKETKEGRKGFCVEKRATINEEKRREEWEEEKKRRERGVEDRMNGMGEDLTFYIDSLKEEEGYFMSNNHGGATIEDNCYRRNVIYSTIVINNFQFS